MYITFNLSPGHIKLVHHTIDNIAEIILLINQGPYKGAHLVQAKIVSGREVKKYTLVIKFFPVNIVTMLELQLEYSSLVLFKQRSVIALQRNLI